MKLLKRVNTVITAQLHEVVEHFENPERILKQTIREMQTTLEQVTEATARSIAGEKLLERKLADARAAAARWQTQARQAVESGNDPAARSALVRRLESERSTSALAAQRDLCREGNERLRRQLDQLRGRLAAAKGEMSALVARQRSAEAQRQFAQAHAAPLADLDTFAAFDELSRRVTEAEAEAEAFAELGGVEDRAALPDQNVERELQLLKAQCEPDRAGGE
jgi:phage shock protein A